MERIFKAAQSRYALVVDDDASVVSAIEVALSGHVPRLASVPTLEAANAVMECGPPGLLFVGMDLPDGSGANLLRAHAPVSWPVIALGEATSLHEARSLGAFGVRAFLVKPFTREGLLAALNGAIRVLPEPAESARAIVGTRGLRTVEAEVRRVMIAEALARTGGNRRAAARLLGVSRQFLQHAIHRLGDGGTGDVGHPASERRAEPAVMSLRIVFSTDQN